MFPIYCRSKAAVSRAVRSLIKQGWLIREDPEGTRQVRFVRKADWWDYDNGGLSTKKSEVNTYDR